MSEFKMVVSEYKRMCESYKNCDYCPMPNFGGDKVDCRRYVFKCPEESENTIMTWAAEHPEPKYPTWADWLESMNLIQVDRMIPTAYMRIGTDNVSIELNRNKLLQPIPAVFAEKHSIPPINSKEN